MNIKTLDGFTKKWNLNSIESENKSGLHTQAASLLKETFPTIHFLEEVQIEVKSNKHLYLDFYIPLFKVAIETDGQQHSKYSNFLSKNPLNFIKQKINDRLKEEWCKLNNIQLIRLDYSEDMDEWKNKLTSFGINNNE